MAIQSNNFTHYAAGPTGTNVLTSERCHLEAVFVNTAGTGGNTVTITDGSGEVIAVRDGTTIHKFDPDLAWIQGLIIVTANGTQGDITVIWQ